MHNFYGITNKVNTFRKGLNLDRYDEPTYLTFSIDFNLDQKSESAFDDPILGSPLFANANEANIDSARRYLGSIGYKDKEQNLEVFKGILEYLTFYAPWYFQSITGLDKMWTAGTDIKKGHKQTTISIETLEAIDLRITELASLYRNAVYDKAHLIERLPENLRWFTMDIYVAEVRNIRYTAGGEIANLFGVSTGAINNLVTQASEAFSALNPDLDLSSVLKQFGYVKFKCRQCEFDFSNSFVGGSELSVKAGDTPAKGSFDIKIGYFEEESEYQDGTKLLDSYVLSKVNDPWDSRNSNAKLANTLGSASNLPFVGPFAQNAQQGVQGALEAIGGLINPTLAAANRFITPSKKSLGNIYE